MKSVRLLALIEAHTITGPAKNLLQFAQSVRIQPVPMEVHIATFQRPGDSTLFANAAHDAQIPFYPLPEKGRFDRTVIPQLTQLVADVKPDIIQSHGVKSHFLVRWSGLNRSIPWIAFHHGYTWPDWKMRLYNQLDRWSLPAANRVLTVSTPFRDELNRHGVSAQRIQVLHNSIDPQWSARYSDPQASRELRAQLGLRPDTRVILTVGRLSREKDHVTLFKALAQLRGAPYKTHLVVIGDGPRRQELAKWVERLGLIGNVRFVGQVRSVGPYYAIADLVVLSSLSEGSPNVLLEAMASRVPVVATEVGGIPEIVKNGESALLVKPRDVAGMAEAMRTLMADRALQQRLVVNAHQTILQRHTPEAYMRRLQAIYTQLIGTPREKGFTPPSG